MGLGKASQPALSSFLSLLGRLVSAHDLVEQTNPKDRRIQKAIAQKILEGKEQPAPDPLPTNLDAIALAHHEIGSAEG